MTPRRDLVLVGADDGGLAALSTILNALPAAFQLPILVGLRTHPESVQTLVRIMSGFSAIPVRYACEGRFARVLGYLHPRRAFDRYGENRAYLQSVLFLEAVGRITLADGAFVTSDCR